MVKVVVDKNNLPYKFELNIKEVIYDFIISYNQTYDFFTITLIKDKIILIESERAVLNQPLFTTVNEAPETTMGIYGINTDVKELTFENLNFQTALVFLED